MISPFRPVIVRHENDSRNDGENQRANRENNEMKHKTIGSTGLEKERKQEERRDRG